MIVNCEKCDTKFKLDDSKVTEKGIKVRCSKCQAVFLVKRPPGEYTMAPDDIKKAIDEALGSEAPAAHTARKSAVSEDMGFSESLHKEKKGGKKDEWGNLVFSDETEGKGIKGSTMGTEEGAGLERTIEFEDTGKEETAEEKIDFGTDEEETSLRQESETGEFTKEGPEEEAPPPSGVGSVAGAVNIERKKPPPPPDFERQEVSLSKLLFMIFLVGILGAGGIMVIKGVISVSTFSNLFSKQEEKKPGQIVSTDIKGNYFQNIRGQKLFIVEGKVINQFDVPRSFIKVKGILYDSNGAEIGSREAFAGWSFSEDELRNLSSKEVDEKLNNKMGESLSNFDIPPNNPRPFMIVFYDVMGAVSSVSVVVVESQVGSQ